MRNRPQTFRFKKLWTKALHCGDLFIGWSWVWCIVCIETFLPHVRIEHILLIYCYTTIKPFKKRLLPDLLSLDFLFIKVHKHPCQSIPIDPLIINMPNWSSTSPPRPLHSPTSKVRSGCQSALFLVFLKNCSELFWLAFVEVLVTVQRRKTHSYGYWLLVAWCYMG